MSDSTESRRLSNREQCFAHAILKNTKAIGYMADISEHGFKVRIMEKLEREAAEAETIGIQLDGGGIPYFELQAHLKWRNDEEKSTILGFKVESFATEEGEASYEAIRKEYGDTPAP